MRGARSAHKQRQNNAISSEFSPIIPTLFAFRFTHRSCGIDLRDDDATTGNRDAYQCVVCGETYGTIEVRGSEEQVRILPAVTLTPQRFFFVAGPDPAHCLLEHAGEERQRREGAMQKAL